MLTDEVLNDLAARVNRHNASAQENLELLGHLSREDREEFARRSGTVALYIGQEVPRAKLAEEEAALRAAPPGYGLEQLNGANLGCGDRPVSSYLIQVDIKRDHDGTAGILHGFSKNALLAMSDQLPFRKESLDFIVALHMLEHVSNPAEVVNHWLDIVKPGGGIGIVVPDWRYTWDSRYDHSPFGHKWNCTPELVQVLFENNWAERSALEAIDTYSYKLSFDFILRKHGLFEPFRPPDPTVLESGHALYQSGRFLTLESEQGRGARRNDASPPRKDGQLNLVK